jgi:carbamoyltransferase
MLILGISGFTADAAAALMRDGKIVAAIENQKLQPGTAQKIPEVAIQFCLEEGKVSWADLDVVAVASNPSSGWMRRAFSRSYFSARSPFNTAYHEGKQAVRFAREASSIRSLGRRTKGPKQVVSLDHHACHAASAFFLSPFEKALILTLDGEGDGHGGMIATGEGNKIRIQKTASFTDSIGRVYSCITEALGFVPSREEHKMQWLSLEGESVFKEFFVKLMRRSGGVWPKVDRRYFDRGANTLFKPSTRFWKEIGIDFDGSKLTPEEKRNLACSTQTAVVEVVSDWIADLQKNTGEQKICLGGGVFYNTLLVAALEGRFGVGNVFVPPAPGNAGCAVGATAWMWHQEMGKPRNSEVRSVFWGPSYTRGQIKDVLDNVKARYTLQNTGEKKLESAVRLLQAGKIVGWFQGATEFGPRALGHRSVLASPWAEYVTENLNDFVKHRESFRPFAVSVREEDCPLFFTASPLCRLMNSLAKVRADANVLPRALQLPNGLVRLHIVERETDPILWELLRRFGEEAPAPILVNTSFNLPGEPPVIRPKDVVRTFFCSGIDAVFADNFLLTKASAAHVLKTPGPGEQLAAAPDRTVT